jgi:glutamine--fructose-6-phosphate transaminase (EC 2.6.1.16)
MGEIITMCGIMGYIGNGNAVPVIIDGLAKLEYRGYDSAGIAAFRGGALEVTKKKDV